MKPYKGKRGIAPLILNQALDGVSGQLHARLLYPRKNSLWYALRGRLGRNQNRFGRTVQYKRSLPRGGNQRRLRGCPIRRPVITPTTLSQTPKQQNVNSYPRQIRTHDPLHTTQPHQPSGKSDFSPAT